MQRSVAFLLVAIGIVCLVVGMMSGCGTLFSFNGRHPIAVEPLVIGVPLQHTFPAKAGRRYTLGVHVVFDREAVADALDGETNGQLVVEARLPLGASIRDAAGLPASKVEGWIDTKEPPTVVLGRTGRATSTSSEELVAERLVGPYAPAQDGEVAYVVEVGADVVGKAPIREMRVVIYDDVLPPSIKVAFAVAGGGALALISGSLMLFLGILRARRGGTRRRQIV